MSIFRKRNQDRINELNALTSQMGGNWANTELREGTAADVAEEKKGILDQLGWNDLFRRDQVAQGLQQGQTNPGQSIYNQSYEDPILLNEIRRQMGNRAQEARDRGWNVTSDYSDYTQNLGQGRGGSHRPSSGEWFAQTSYDDNAYNNQGVLQPTGTHINVPMTPSLANWNVLEEEIAHAEEADKFRNKQQTTDYINDFFSPQGTFAEETRAKDLAKQRVGGYLTPDTQDWSDFTREGYANAAGRNVGDKQGNIGALAAAATLPNPTLAHAPVFQGGLNVGIGTGGYDNSTQLNRDRQGQFHGEAYKQSVPQQVYDKGGWFSSPGFRDATPEEQQQRQTEIDNRTQRADNYFLDQSNTGYGNWQVDPGLADNATQSDNNSGWTSAGTQQDDHDDWLEPQDNYSQGASGNSDYEAEAYGYEQPQEDSGGSDDSGGGK